jgi:predicted nucleotidyltransferase
MLADFLLTPKQQRILGAFVLNPERAYSLSELFELTGGGRSSTQDFVAKLLAGDVVLQQSGGRALYQANTQHPLYPELRQIAVKSFGLKEPIERALAMISDKIKYAFIFGSMAAGTAGSASDIDVMVIGDARLGRVQRELDVAGEALGREIHVSVYPEHEWEQKRRSDPVLESIDQGPKIMLDVSTSTD